jgi:hypothetical protein
MYLFKDYTLRWWQVSLLKISMVAFGLAVGATWPGAFAGWIGLLWVLFIVPAVSLTFITFKQIQT